MSYRILIVDDDREAAKMLRMSLEVLGTGYEVTDILSGEEAVLEMQTLAYDLLITDYRLPGITGVELINQVRAVDAEIPIMLVSGQAIPPIRREIAASGYEVADIFQKPFDTNLILNRVNEVLLGEETAANVPAQADAVVGTDRSTVDEKALFGRLDALQRELEATAAALVDHEGGVVSLAGILDQSLRFSQLASLLAQNFAASSEIAEYLGDVKGLYTLHYYSGSDYDIYALPADEMYFMALVIPADGQTQMGIVLRYARPVLRDIRGMLSGTSAVTEADPAEESYPDEPVVDADDGEVFLDIDSDTSQFIFRTAEDREKEEAARAAAAAEVEEAWLAEDNATLDDFFQPADASNAVNLDLDALDEAIADKADADDFWSNAVDIDEESNGYSMEDFDLMPDEE